MPEKGGIAKFLEKDTAGIPNWGWLAIIALGIGAAYILPKFLGQQGNSQAGTDQGSNTAGLGLAIDPATGLPYAVEGLVPSGGQAGGTNVDLTATNNLLQQLLAAQQAQQGSSTTTTNTTTINNAFQNFGVRGRMGSAEQAGIPIRSSPGGAVIGHLGYGGRVQVLGTAVTGPSNNSQTKGVANSTQWYPVAGGGYVSAADVSPEASAGARTGGSTGAASNAHFNVPGPGMGAASFVDRIRNRFSTVAQTSGTVDTSGGNVNVSSGGESASIANGNLQVKGPEGSVSITGDNLSITGPEGNISITDGRFNPVLRWPFTETNFQQFAASRGISFQRLFELNPNLFNSDRIVSGQQMRVS